MAMVRVADNAGRPISGETRPVDQPAGIGATVLPAMVARGGEHSGAHPRRGGPANRVGQKADTATVDFVDAKGAAWT